MNTKDLDLVENNINIANNIVVNLQHQYGERLDDELRGKLRNVVSSVCDMSNTLRKRKIEYLHKP